MAFDRNRRAKSPLPTPPYPTMTHAEVRVLGQRNWQAGAARLRPEDFQDFEAVLAEFRKTHPSYTVEQLVRYVWAKGLVAARWAITTRSLPVPPK